MSKHKRNHIATQSYLKRFVGSNGKLGAVDVIENARLADRSPRSVGFVHNFWGDSTDLRQSCEVQAGRIEADGPGNLDLLVENWAAGIDPHLRTEISRFIGLHVCRNVAARKSIDSFSRASVRRHSEKHRLELGDRYADFVRLIESDEYKAESMIDQIRLSASLVGSMHWSILQSEKPLFGTGDHPVMFYPAALPNTQTPIQSVPVNGFFSTFEMRFPIDPHHLLLGSWLEEKDSRVMFRADLEAIADANAGTYALASSHFLFNSDVSQPWLIAPPRRTQHCAPLSFKYLHGYSIKHARQSKRKVEAMSNVSALIEDQILDEVRIVLVDEAA